MNLKQITVSAALAVAALGAQAGMVGATLKSQYYFPDLSSPFSTTCNTTFVVGSGVETCGLYPDLATLDVTDTQVIIEFLRGDSRTTAAFNGFVLSDVGSSLDAITGVTVDASSTWTGLDASRLSFTADSLGVNWQGLRWTAGQRLVLNVALDSPVVVTPAIPVPGTLALAALGLGVLVARRQAARAA